MLNKVTEMSSGILNMRQLIFGQVVIKSHS